MSTLTSSLTHLLPTAQDFLCDLIRFPSTPGQEADVLAFIAERFAEVAPEVEAWVHDLARAGLRACILSNAASARRVQPVAERLSLPWITRALKPLSFGLLVM